MVDLCFLIKLKFCIWLTVSCIEGKKWLFHLLFVSKSQQQALGINIHSGFSNTRQKPSIASAHTPSPYPTFIWGMVVASWVVRFCILLYLNSALWSNFSLVRMLLQNSWILSSASLMRPRPLDQIAEPKTVDSSPSLSDLLKDHENPWIESRGHNLHRNSVRASFEILVKYFSFSLNFPYL